MKKLFIVSLFILMLGSFFLWKDSHSTKITRQKDIKVVQDPVNKKISKRQNSLITSPFDVFLFVPYWSLKNNLGTFNLPNISQQQNLDTLIYFGITVDESGINTQEPGYNGIETFIERTSPSTHQKLLTLRMTNENHNEKILSSQELQNIVIEQTLNISTSHDFDGIVVDLEHSVLPTQKTIDAITQFLKIFAEKTHQNNQLFAVTLYGDTFYRQRPYNTQAIGEFSDLIMIMSYDFHKSYGEPGPNFPLTQGDTYPYSLEKMLENFSTSVNISKIIPIFGIYGYDWSIDDQNRPLTSAKALTFAQTNNKFLKNCQYSPCTISRDDTSAETRISYKDSSGQNHAVWFEDPVSVTTKAKTVQTFGIDKIGYWAYGYY